MKQTTHRAIQAFLCGFFLIAFFGVLHHAQAQGLDPQDYDQHRIVSLYPPDFTDDRCLHAIEGLYWHGESNYVKATMYSIVEPLTLEVRGSSFDMYRRPERWEREDGRGLMRIKASEPKEKGDRNFETELRFCMGDNRLVLLIIRNDFSDQPIKILGHIGRPSTTISYNLWEIIEDPAGRVGLHHDVGFENIYHTAHSPYLKDHQEEKRRHDVFFTDDFDQAIAARSIVPLRFEDPALLDASFAQLPKGHIGIIPTGEQNFQDMEETQYRALIEEAPLLLYPESPVFPYHPDRSLDAMTTSWLEKKNASLSDFEGSQSRIDQILADAKAMESGEGKPTPKGSDL